MKKSLSGAMITLTVLFALAAGAKAETGVVRVHIKQDFVAAGKMLPAGTYRVERSFYGAGQVLILRGEEPGTSVFLVPSSHEGAVPERRSVTLRRVGDMYYLSEVATDLGVFNLPTPRTVADSIEAKNRDRINSSESQ
ncbi:MAG: hypothetical protein ACRD2Q_07100 [Terriglobales bacterium]